MSLFAFRVGQHEGRKARAVLHFPQHSGVLLEPLALGCFERWREHLDSQVALKPQVITVSCVTGSKTECLNLAMTEVVKRQNSKSKKSFNQVTRVMVLSHLVTGGQPDVAGEKQGGREELFGGSICCWPRGLHEGYLAPLPCTGRCTAPGCSSLRLFFSQQISVSQIKVDKVQIIGVQSSFAVCLDQDEQKILQSVTR